MIFNQNLRLDAYFNSHASENWQLDNGNRMSACHICAKHKLTMIFYD
jgi:hypothetical protein